MGAYARVAAANGEPRDHPNTMLPPILPASETGGNPNFCAKMSMKQAISCPRASIKVARFSSLSSTLTIKLTSSGLYGVEPANARRFMATKRNPLANAADCSLLNITISKRLANNTVIF